MTNELEHYRSIKPFNKELQKYIAYYYFVFSLKKDAHKAYIFYPHYKNAITVYKNSKISLGENSSCVSFDLSKGYEIIYTGIHMHSRMVKIETPFNKIGIVFQPLGLNNFIKEPLSDVVDVSPKLNFDYFGNTFNTVLNDVYASDTVEQKVDILDAFFINKLNVFQEDRLIEAVNLIFDQELSVQELSEALNINRKTLFRLFKKHFKKVTGFNPKKFFSNISHIGRIIIYYNSSSTENIFKPV